jgi:hypothetical protein
MSPKAGWILKEGIAPRLGGAVPRSVACIGIEDAQELVADSICMAAKMIDRVEQQGKLNQVTPGNISYYTIQHMKSGRRASGCSTADVHGIQSQLNGNSELHSLQEIVAETETGDVLELHDTLSTASDDPSMIVARHLDWQMVLRGMSKLELRIVQALADGLTFRQVGRLCKVSLRRLRELQQRLALKVVEVMGLDVLATIAIRPQWKINLLTIHEQLACRGDRRN